MPKLKYNSTGVEKGIDPPVPGTYPMKIESCTYEEESSQGERIVVKAVMTQPDAEGKGKGYGFWDYVGLDVDWKVDQWLNAIGIDTEDNPEGEFDTKDFVGKMILGRVKEDYYQGDYKPKLARALPYRAQDDEDGWDDDSELEDEPGEESEEPSEDAADEAELPYQEDMAELGELADDGDEDALVKLMELAEYFEMDTDEYATWADFAEAVTENLEPKPKPKPAKATAKKAATPAKKTVAKKAAGAAKKAAAPPADEDEPADDDYDTWTVDDLKTELESRELPTGGNKTALIARLRKNDADPF